ncbi:hypothetical protein RJ640_005761 [Escallonia rubra]|uniref:Probable glutathione S-transferase n=1 Tax=Escallonia rubra TaxID=112253 RepID=A0AA88RG46_9ASTE|nr:hypothetical protein RJ640_005761 [Escallonia rubra]
MASQEVKLIGFWISPFVHRVEWALKLKGVEYEYIEEDIFNKSPLLLELNPVHKKVPVMVHRGKVIVESFVILEYIEETWKESPLLPRDPYERAMARFWAKFAEEELLEDAWIALCSHGIQKERAVKSAIDALEKIEGEIKGKSFFGGEAIGSSSDNTKKLCNTVPMASQEVKLIGFWVSPFVRRVEWALKLKGVEYEYIEDDIFNKSPLLLELNPVHKRVPVMVHGGKVIVESFVILEYIEETWKESPLLPRDPYERAMARFWAKFAEEEVLDNAWIALCSRGSQKEKAVKSTIDALEKIEGELKGKSFFGGEAIGYLDLALGWISYWLPVWDEISSLQLLDSLKFPSITTWQNNFLENPVIKENLPPKEKMVVYFHNRSKELAPVMASSRHA